MSNYFDPLSTLFKNVTVRVARPPVTVILAWQKAVAPGFLNEAFLVGAADFFGAEVNSQENQRRLSALDRKPTFGRLV